MRYLPWFENDELLGFAVYRIKGDGELTLIGLERL
jgi:hypothetical protein